LIEEYRDCEDLKVPAGWSHERSSLQMIDAALQELGLQIDLKNLDKPLKQIGDGIKADSFRVFKPSGLSTEEAVLTSRDFVFIKECIYGEPLPEVVETLGKRSFMGRTEKSCEWLYDVVNNRHSGLDVDKLDYFARDSLRASAGSGGKIHTKMLEDARVARALCSDPEKCIRCQGISKRHHFMICYPSKHVTAAMDFFKTRLLLHKLIYQHKKTVAVGSMICDILCLADPYFRLESRDGERFPISRAILKSEFLMEVDDNVLHDIYRSKDPRLAEARALILRLRKHDIYKCSVDQALDIDAKHTASVLDDMEDEEERSLQDSKRDRKIWKMSDREIKDGILKELGHWKQDHGGEPVSLDENEFTVEKYYMHHGKKDQNPLSGMRFFDEMNEKLTATMEELPIAIPAKECNHRSIIPQSLHQAGVRILCRERTKRALVHQVFLQWFERMAQRESGGAENTPFPRVQLPFQQDGNKEDDDDDMDDDDEGHARNPVMLSQESDAEDDDDDDRHGRSQAQLDQSPIPVRTR
jgi:deoxynucleoside triphosphate triphosphohydrolase SAMHD1